MSINKVILIGNLGADPEVRTFPDGGMLANVSIATTERWNDRQTGERRERTEWHRVVFNNRLAEIAQQYLRKGSKVYVEGSIRTNKWQDQNGQDRYSTEIRAQQMQMLDSNPNAGQYQGGGFQGQPQGQYQGGYQNQNQGFQNQGQPANGANSFGTPPASQHNPQQVPQQTAPQQTNAVPPSQPPANPNAPAMSDAPADDDIPF